MSVITKKNSVILCTHDKLRLNKELNMLCHRSVHFTKSDELIKLTLNGTLNVLLVSKFHENDTSTFKINHKYILFFFKQVTQTGGSLQLLHLIQAVSLVISYL